MHSNERLLSDHSVGNESEAIATQPEETDETECIQSKKACYEAVIQPKTKPTLP
jgi:hypothetical protein